MKCVVFSMSFAGATSGPPTNGKLHQWRLARPPPEAGLTVVGLHMHFWEHHGALALASAASHWLL